MIPYLTNDDLQRFSKAYQHKEVRQGIAKKGMKKVLENHTQVQRVDFIIEQYEKWKNE